MESFDDAYLSQMDVATVRAMAAVALALGVPAVVAAVVLGGSVLVMEAGLGPSAAAELAAVAASLGICLLGLCAVLLLSLIAR